MQSGKSNSAMNHLSESARLARECELSLRMAIKESSVEKMAYPLCHWVDLIALAAERLGTLAQLSGENADKPAGECSQCGRKVWDAECVGLRCGEPQIGDFAGSTCPGFICGTYAPKSHRNASDMARGLLEKRAAAAEDAEAKLNAIDAAVNESHNQSSPDAEWKLASLRVRIRDILNS